MNINIPAIKWKKYYPENNWIQLFSLLLYECFQTAEEGDDFVRVVLPDMWDDTACKTALITVYLKQNNSVTDRSLSIFPRVFPLKMVLKYIVLSIRSSLIYSL